MSAPTAPPRSASGAAPTGPVPRRVRPPRWLDLRLVLGVLLVLGSVLIGARVVSAADTTATVWAAAGDLGAGTVLGEDDLTPVAVRLADVGPAYLATSTRPQGRVLARAVGSGELLPRTALEEAADVVQLALPVQAGYVPPGLGRGQLVDVYAVADPAAGAAATGGDVDRVLAAAPVQAVSGRGSGVLSTSSSSVQVVVSVPRADAAGVLSAIGGRALVVASRASVDAVDDGGTAGIDPGTAPGTAGGAGTAPATGASAGPTG